MQWAAAAVGIFAGALSVGAQREVDRDRVDLQYADNLEKIRRREWTQENQKGLAKARSENSGVLHSGGSTAQGALDTMANEFGRELRWMKEYAKKSKQLGIRSASVKEGAGYINAVSSGLSAGSMFS